VRRVLAVLVAIGLIAGASFLRSRHQADEVAGQQAAGQLTGNLVCATELAKVCDDLRTANPSLQVRTEEAGTTAATLAAATFNRDTAKIDAWLVPQPYPAMVEDTRRLAGLEPALGTPSAVLARSPVVAVVWNDRRTALQKKTCPGEITWTCLGPVAGEPWIQADGEESWGKVKPGHGPPDKSATGLLVLSQATAVKLDRSDFAKNDFDDPDYQTWLGQLERGIPTFTPSTGSPLGQMQSQGRSSFDIAGSIEAVAGPSVTGSRDEKNLTILYPSPVVTADVVVVAVRGSEQGEHMKQRVDSVDTSASLARAGWRVPGQASAAGVLATPVLPPSSGLPTPGALVALIATWSEVKR